MGYRHYFHAVPKIQIEEIRKCKTNDDFCKWAKSRGYEVEEYDGEKPYCSIFRIGKEVYEFGKYVDWAFAMEDKNESVFTSKELKQMYEDYGFVLCSQDDFLTAINEYRLKIVSYLESLLSNDEESENRRRRDLEERLEEWNNSFVHYAINTNLEQSKICNSWLYEYAIFELTRVYKAFDWENDALVLVGW